MKIWACSLGAYHHCGEYSRKRQGCKNPWCGYQRKQRPVKWSDHLWKQGILVITTTAQAIISFRYLSSLEKSVKTLAYARLKASKHASAVGLNSSLMKKTRSKVAGGFLVQVLPNAKEEIASFEKQLRNADHFYPLMTTILKRFLLPSMVTNHTSVSQKKRSASSVTVTERFMNAQQQKHQPKRPSRSRRTKTMARKSLANSVEQLTT